MVSICVVSHPPSRTVKLYHRVEAGRIGLFVWYFSVGITTHEELGDLSCVNTYSHTRTVLWRWAHL